MIYKVCENGIFKSIQGEGFNSGRSAVFIRLSGCNMEPRCPFCDENFDNYFEMTLQRVLHSIKQLVPFSMIVITGGEPTLIDLSELLDALHSCGYFVAIETNGINDCCLPFDWITCSPKTENVRIKFANELKFIVDRTDDSFIEYIDRISRSVSHEYLYLQPMSNEKEMINRSLNIINNHPEYYLSLQIHKIIDIK